MIQIESSQGEWNGDKWSIEEIMLNIIKHAHLKSTSAVTDNFLFPVVFHVPKPAVVVLLGHRFYL